MLAQGLSGIRQVYYQAELIYVWQVKLVRCQLCLTLTLSAMRKTHSQLCRQYGKHPAIYQVWKNMYMFDPHKSMSTPGFVLVIITITAQQASC